MKEENSMTEQLWNAHKGMTLYCYFATNKIPPTGVESQEIANGSTGYKTDSVFLLQSFLVV
jgi:hypothetical protein